MVEAEIWSCDLRANERPKKKSNGKGTNTQTDRRTSRLIWIWNGAELKFWPSLISNQLAIHYIGAYQTFIVLILILILNTIFITLEMVLWNAREKRALHSAHCILSSAHYTLHSAHCTLQSGHLTVHTAKCTLHRAHNTLHTTQTTN